MIIGFIRHGRPTVMRRLLIRSKRRVLIASDYLERALVPGRASTRQSWQGATDRDRSRPLVPCREVVSRNRNERSGCSRVDTGNRARTGRDRSRPVRKSVVWTRPNAQCTPTDWQSAISPTADWESAFVGRCVPNAAPIVGVRRRYSADSKFESALEPVGASR